MSGDAASVTGEPVLSVRGLSVRFPAKDGTTVTRRVGQWQVPDRPRPDAADPPSW
jgi:hypothetical protein